MLSFLFKKLTQLRTSLYEKELLKSHSLNGPTISVGNLTLGGTGKTPVVAYLCRLVQEWDLEPVILSRGYRGNAENKNLIVSNRQEILCKPEDCGDEAFLLADSLPGTIVVTGKNRLDSAKLVENLTSRPAYILDDGYQHLSIRRDVDLLLIDATNPFGGDRLLPFGRLREPISAVDRADAVLITRSHLENSRKSIEARIRPWNTDAPVFSFSHCTHPLYPLRKQQTAAAQDITGRSFVALAAIGNPRQFLKDLENQAFNLAGQALFRDHHAYSRKDLLRVFEKVKKTGADGVITTEKDAIRLRDLEWPEVQVYILPISATCQDESTFHEWLARNLIK
jgi:tetraacyldisaccharide 4'-kinase